LKKVGTVSGFIKKIQRLSYDFDIFWNFLELFFIGKVMDRVYGSRDHGWLSVHCGLTAMGRRDRSGAREVIVIAQRERERRRRRRKSSEFSPMVSLGGRAVEMVTRQRSTKVAGGAPMGRWFRT
jgi:hypothetical protein